MNNPNTKPDNQYYLEDEENKMFVHMDSPIGEEFTTLRLKDSKAYCHLFKTREGCEQISQWFLEHTGRQLTIREFPGIHIDVKYDYTW